MVDFLPFFIRQTRDVKQALPEGNLWVMWVFKKPTCILTLSFYCFFSLFVLFLNFMPFCYPTLAMFIQHGLCSIFSFWQYPHHFQVQPCQIQHDHAIKKNYILFSFLLLFFFSISDYFSFCFNFFILPIIFMNQAIASVYIFFFQLLKPVIQFIDKTQQF